MPSRRVTLTEDDVMILLTALNMLYRNSTTHTGRDTSLLSLQRFQQLQRLLAPEGIKADASTE